MDVDLAFMARLMDDAGVGPGMRVLDLGCGGGAVTVLASGRVGSGGAVMGVDLPGPTLDAARAAAAAGLGHVTFRALSLDEPLPHDLGRFDAIVAR